jgi:hypothetical protein
MRLNPSVAATPVTFMTQALRFRQVEAVCGFVAPHLNCPHVDPPSQVEVPVQKVPMPVSHTEAMVRLETTLL